MKSQPSESSFPQEEPLLSESERKQTFREREAQPCSWRLSEMREETKLEAEVNQSLTYGNRLVFAPGGPIFTTCVSNLVMQENFA